MTKEEFFEYLCETSCYDGDDIICVEYHENKFSYFGIYNSDTYYGNAYRLYEINENGDCVSLCDSAHEKWQTNSWPNASNEDYQDYVINHN